MKKQRNVNLLPAGVLVLSCVGFFLRSMLYGRALDEKNLLLRQTPVEMLLWVCTLAAAVLILLGSRKQISAGKTVSFGTSLPAVIGHILAACGILLTVLLGALFDMSALGKLWKLAGFLAAPLLLWAAFDRLQGKRPFFGAYGVCSVFFALHLISHYQSWCADPQLQNYVFAFGAMMALMLFAYQQCAACVGMGNRQHLQISGLLAGYFCLVAAANTRQLYLLLGCAAWAVTGACLPEDKGENNEPRTVA